MPTCRFVNDYHHVGSVWSSFSSASLPWFAIALVDNWRIQASDPQVACVATSAVSSVTKNLGMSLSPDKSIAHATFKEFRGVFRRLSVENVFVPVANDFADVGVQFCTRKASCAKGLQRRADKNLFKLERLHMLPWSITKIVACLMRLVFPSDFPFLLRVPSEANATKLFGDPRTRKIISLRL